MIILNEKEFAESCINNGQIVGKPFFTLSILAKYYYHHLGYRKKKITSLLIDFMEKNYPHYENNKLDWDANIERIASNAGKYTLYQIDGVWITQSELDAIAGIHNKVLERLIFTFLCLAKLGNIKNPQNNGWVNVGDKEIFTLARITCNLQDRDIKIGKLRKLGLLELPKRNDNLSCRVTFVDDESEKVLQVYDFRELGYEYLKYKGENYIRCSECDILTKGNKNGTKKYCSACAQYSPQETKTIKCADCGYEFQVDSKNNRTCRCVSCQREFIKAYDRERKKNRNSV